MEIARLVCENETHTFDFKLKKQSCSVSLAYMRHNVNIAKYLIPLIELI